MNSRMNTLRHIKSGVRKAMRAFKRVFAIRREERATAIVALVLMVALNALVLLHYHELLTKPTRFYWTLFIRNFHISGFDPITCVVVSKWGAYYNIYRHPLLAFYMYPLYLINQALMWLTGCNCAIYVVAAAQVFCGLYSLLFLRRILRDIVEAGKTASTVLTLLFFSFAYVMLSTAVPDHFVISMMLLLLTLWLAGGWMKDGRRMTVGHTWLLFFLTAGVSLNNGLKTFLTALFVNRSRFFRPKHLLLAVVLPAALIWGSARWGYRELVWPRETAQHQANAKKEAEKKRKAQERKMAQMRADSITLANGGTVERPKEKPKRKAKKQRKQGRPISNGEFMKWTDITTSRSESIVENLLGESIQLHDKHLLEDTLRKRPVIVNYSWAFNYVIEAVLAVLFIVGIWFGRRSRFLWMALSWTALDMALHLGLGFGLNEIYIMSAHWIFVMPIAMAFAVKSLPPSVRRWSVAALSALSLWLLIYNGRLVAIYLL